MKFRDILALGLGVVMIPGLWIVTGLGFLNLPEVIIGVTISIETLIVNFYFRKKPRTETIE